LRLLILVAREGFLKEKYSPQAKKFEHHCHKWSSFWAILAHVTWSMAQQPGQSISLKFLSETRLESESFEPLIDFLAFLVQKFDLK